MDEATKAITELLSSNDFRYRLVGEFCELCIRIEKLQDFLLPTPAKWCPLFLVGFFVLVPLYSLPSAFHTDILRTRRDAALSGHTYKWEASYV